MNKLVEHLRNITICQINFVIIIVAIIVSMIIIIINLFEKIAYKNRIEK